MFRPASQAKGGFAKSVAAPSSRLVYMDEDQNLGTELKNPEFKVQPYGTTTRLFVEAYKVPTLPPPRPYPTPDAKFEALRSNVNEWAMNQERTEKAYRILRSSLDIETQAKAIQSQFTTQVSAALPTGAAAQKAYADFARISSYFNRADYVSLIKPDVIMLIAAGVTPQISTPLFTAFLEFMRQPDPDLVPNRQAKAMVVDLVKRAVLSQNPSFQWSDFVSPSATAAPAAPASTASPTGAPTSAPTSAPSGEKGGFSSMFGSFG